MVLDGFTRRQAFLTHLAVSGVIFIVIAYLIIYHWYPDFYFTLDGGLRGIATIFFVDIVLGPGLTLLVFKPGKKSLRFDMSVILLFQLIALSWGVHSVYSERSGSAVFYWGKFSCVSHNDTAAMAMDSIAAGPSGKQRLGFLKAPDTLEAFHDFVSGPFKAGSSEIYFYADKIVPLDGATVEMLGRYQLSLDELRKENPDFAASMENYTRQNPGSNATYKLIPLACRYGNAIAVYDMQEMRVENLLEINTKIRAADSKELIPTNISVKYKTSEQ
jgi:hypothetical protein